MDRSNIFFNREIMIEQTIITEHKNKMDTQFYQKIDKHLHYEDLQLWDSEDF